MRWLNTLSEFDFEIHHIPGSENVLADALSRMYSNEQPGTVRAETEYVSSEDTDNGEWGFDLPKLKEMSEVIYTGQMVAAEYALGLQGGSGAKAISKASMNTRSTRQNNLPDTSGADEIFFRPAGKQINTIPEDSARSRSTYKVDKMVRSGGQTESGSISRRVTTRSMSSEDLNKSLKAGVQHGLFESDELSDSSSQLDRSMSGTEAVSAIRDRKDLAQPVAVYDTLAEVNLPSCLRNRYSSDEFFKRIVGNVKEFKNFEFEDGLLSVKSAGKVLLCIPDIAIGGRKIREILIKHAHSLLAHLGSAKTLSYLRESVWWPRMVHDVKFFCASCSVCTVSKSNTQKPLDHLKPLSIPSRPWQSIGIDFVGPLPESRNRDSSFDMICTVIDHLTSMVLLIPCRQDYNAKDTAELVFDEVYKKHGLPEIIVSDRDSLFTSQFWERLHR